MLNNNRKPINLALAALLSMLMLSVAPAQAAEIDATVQWLKRVELATAVPGVVRQVHVQPGEVVETNTLLLSLDDSVYAARLNQARSRFQAVTRIRDEAVRELERAQELYDSTLISEHELELVRIDQERTQADYETAKADMAAAEYNFQYSKIHAPFKGMVIEQRAHAGQVVSPELQPAALLVFAQTDRMLVRGHASFEQVAKLKPGQSVEVLLEGRKEAGKIYRIAYEPSLNRKEDGLYPVEAEIQVKGRNVLAGQKARLILP